VCPPGRILQEIHTLVLVLTASNMLFYAEEAYGSICYTDSAGIPLWGLYYDIASRCIALQY
jgi:hypothetical protein